MIWKFIDVLGIVVLCVMAVVLIVPACLIVGAVMIVSASIFVSNHGIDQFVKFVKHHFQQGMEYEGGE